MISGIKKASFVLASFILLNACAGQHRESTIPVDQKPDFVALEEIDPSIIQEIRYAGSHNFIGRPITGYKAEKCLLTRKAAQALMAVQSELKSYSLSLKVYDCYRPQRAVSDFSAWAKDGSDTKMKKEFYPRLEKTSLFKDGYIAEKSGHSRGSTVDITIVPLPVPAQSEFKSGQSLQACYLPKHKRFNDNSLDMGTGFDCCDVLSHTANPDMTATQKRNRLLLKSTMEKFGFKNLAEEWWHYTLRDEPYPNQYFDFEIK